MRRKCNFEQQLRICEIKMAASGQNIENLVQKLHSSSLFTLKKTLAIVARITKRSNEADLFRKSGGLAGLLSLLKRPNNSVIDMSMSAIANCSMFPECKKEIRQLDGILPIVSVLKNLKSTSILNRTARALANLAEDEDNAVVIEELGAIDELAKLLDETSDADCQQSLLRSLKIICTTQSRKRTIIEQGCLKTIVELLKSNRPALQSCSLKTICELTKNCPKELALHIQEFDGIKEIVKLASSEKHSICSVAVLSIVNLCVHAHVRVSIGSEGGINILYQQAKLNSSNHLNLTLKALEGLCFCCREAVNRNKVLECGGIELLLKHFSDPKHPSLQRKIITAFNCFYYNEKCLEFLLIGGIVPALLSYLTKVIQTSHAVDHCDDYSDHFDQESFTSDFSSPSASPRTMPMESPSISLNETFLEEAASLAMEVRDAKESNRVLTFKRKRSKQPLTSSPSAKSIDQSCSLFSFSSLDCTTETTCMMSTCTISSSNATTSPFMPIHSYPRTLISSTPSQQETNSKSSSPNILTNVNLDEKSPDQDKLAVGGMCVSPFSQNSITNSGSESAIESPKTFDITTFPCSQNSSTKSLFVKPALESPKAVNLHTCTLNESKLGGEYSPQKAATTPPPLSSPKQDAPLVSHHAVHGPGHSALVLLSRFSQMGDQKGLHYLLTKPCMEVLLSYLSLVDNPSPKCARLLNNLTLDPQCFESFVGMGLACDIHQQLCWGWTDAYCTEEKLSKQEIAEGSALNEDHVIEALFTKIPECSIQRCTGIGRKLLDNMACQTQTPFGKGVLMHLLSKGSGEELYGCIVTLPFTCRSKRLQNQMLIIKGGLKLLCDALLTTSNDRNFAKAVYSLSVLSVETELNIETPASVSTQSSIIETQGSVVNRDNMKTGKRKLFTESEITEEGNVETSPKRQKFCSNEKGSCKYHHNDYGPYDIQLELDTGARFPVHRSVLSKSSDMFTAMFSSNYKEGSMPIVQLKEITHNALCLAVHKAYGCAFPYFQGTEATNVCSHVTEIFNSITSDAKFNLLVDLLATADKFLMLELKYFCESVLPLLVNESNLVSLCLCAAHYHSDKLCAFGMKFLMLKVKDLSCQCSVAKQICKSQEKTKLVNSLYETLLHHLQKRV